MGGEQPRPAGIDRDSSPRRRGALGAFLSPDSIAVVGAGSDPDTIAGLLFANLVASHFGGAVLPVNRKHRAIQGLVAYPDLSSCPMVPDLVFVCVPTSAVAGVVAEAGELGVGAVCIITAGFAETGDAGAAIQAAVVQEATAGGVRIVGPNCVGILSGRGNRRFNATFGRTVPRQGPACLLAQSGAIGIALLEAAEVRGIGIGSFVSVGNSVDVSCNDLLSHWGDDPETGLILLYLESIPEPAEFVRIARQVSRRIPIVVVKTGSTEAGSRAAASHTAALAAGEVGVEALFRQAGVIRAASIEEMLDVATVLSSQQLFRGRRTAIVTNGGGPGILAADACEANGLVVPPLPAATAAQLRAFLPPEASVSNPVDMIASATAGDYGKAVRVVGETAGVDALMVMFNTPLLTSSIDVATELVACRAELDQDVALIAVMMNKDGPPPVLRAAAIPSFVFPENAARALARAVSWAERRESPVGQVRRPEVDVAQVERIVGAARARAHAGGGWVAAADADALLTAYGIALVRSCQVRTPEQAASAQAAFGCTVVVKLASAIHKSDVGAVVLDVATPTAAGDAVRSIEARMEAAGIDPSGVEFLVQEQISAALEMFVGARRDPAVGPLTMVGLGGKLVEVLDDVAARIAPLTDLDIDEMLCSLRSFKLLNGYRGAPVLDVEALRRVLRGVSALVQDLPEVSELDLNPVFVLVDGAVAADVRIRLGDRTEPG